MEKDAKRGGVLVAAIVFIAIAVLAAGGAAFFMIDGMRVNNAIAEVDSIEYEETTAEKGEQPEAKGVALTAEETPESLEGDIYHTPMGFSIVSHSDAWEGQKLVDIYNELLQNGHGDEIRYLSEVVLYGGNSDYAAVMAAAGDRSDADVDKYVYVDVPALIPSGLMYDTRAVVSVLSLYNMDDYSDAADVAETLSHEYGHHFTMYYFMQNDRAVKDSEYYTLRGFENIDHQFFYSTALAYYENHMWDIYEIAAEDYVQLLGSPGTRLTQEYMDGRDLLESDLESYSPSIQYEYHNVFPQENIFIPLADEVSGLRDYFYSWIDKPNEYDSELQTVDFGLQIEKKSSNGKRYYNITWNMTNTDPDALYTLVCYTEEGDLYWPVRTVYGNEDPIAVVGSPTVRRNWDGGYTIYWWSDGVPDEDRIFKLYLMLPDGRMQASDPFYVEF